MIGSIVYWNNDQWVVQRVLTRAEKLRRLINSPGTSMRSVSHTKANSVVPFLLQEFQEIIAQHLRFSANIFRRNLG